MTFERIALTLLSFLFFLPLCSRDYMSLWEEDGIYPVKDVDGWFFMDKNGKKYESLNPLMFGLEGTCEGVMGSLDAKRLFNVDNDYEAVYDLGCGFYAIKNIADKRVHAYDEDVCDLGVWHEDFGVLIKPCIFIFGKEFDKRGMLSFSKIQSGGANGYIRKDGKVFYRETGFDGFKQYCPTAIEIK